MDTQKIAKGLCVTLDLAEIYRVTRESPQDGNVSRETSYACEAWRKDRLNSAVGFILCITFLSWLIIIITLRLDPKNRMWPVNFGINLSTTAILVLLCCHAGYSH